MSLISWCFGKESTSIGLGAGFEIGDRVEVKSVGDGDIYNLLIFERSSAGGYNCVMDTFINRIRLKLCILFTPSVW